MKWRNTLLVAALLMGIGYAAVVLVALIVSGNELLTQPLAYYAAIMPFIYLAFCIATALGRIPTQAMPTYGLLMHIVAAPCVVFSFLGIGLLLPLLAFLWLQTYRWQVTHPAD
jgi:hypothetical protein